MRRQRLVRNGSSTHSLCIFCASRFLLSGLPATTAVPRRRLNTTRSPRQSAAAAAAQPLNGNGNVHDPPVANQGNSSLTPAEQREKAHRRQQYEAAEHERLRQHRKHLERQAAAQQAAKQADEQRRLDELERREAAVRKQEEAEQERLRREETSRSATRGETSRVQGSLLPRRVQSNTPDQPFPKGRPNENQLSFSKHHAKGQSDFRQAGHKNLNFRGNGAGRERWTNSSTAMGRMGMPDFSSAPNSQSSLDGGWGSGASETQPLKYATEEQRLAREAELKARRASPRISDPREPSDVSSTMSSVFPDLDLNARSRDANRRSEARAYSRRGPSRNQDNFWSSQSASDQPPPPPPPRQPSNVSSPGEFGGTGYRTIPFNPSEDYSSSPFANTSTNTDSNNSWSHLRRRDEAHQPPQQTPPPPPNPFRSAPPPGPSYRQSQDEIDRNFRDYQAQRAQRAPPMQYSYGAAPIAASPMNPDRDDAATKAKVKCARCHAYGHPARECTAPPEKVRATCNFCGEMGHLSVECPSKYRRGGARSVFSQTSSPAFRRMESNGPDAFPVERSAVSERTEAPTRQDTQWRPFEAPRQHEESQQEELEVAQRRARRTRRGFEDEVEEVRPRFEQNDRRKGRRSMEQEDDEAADEAIALREERAARKSARKAAKRRAAGSGEHQPTPLTLPEFISVSQLAQALNVRYERLLERLEQEGYDDVFPAKILNMETSGMIAMEYNFEPQFEYDTAVAREEQERDLKPRPELEDKSLLPTRPPVVTIMGHVDHGKTTILDYLRKSSVAAGEAGGITQHIGAFSVPMSSSSKAITFLDTPGHAAFLAMRQRGANVTDIVVLVVAADDSVKPQTLESLRCAREAGVPILVAINKVDKEGADVQRVKQDLAKHGVEIEDFGGDVQTVELSGKTGQGMAEFEEAIVTLSEILDHRAETDGDIEGWVLEATTKTHGRVATVLVKRGTLRVGQIIVAGKTWARVRTLKNERGQTLQEVGPGMPVEVDGWKEQATAGDQVLQAANEQKASHVVEYRTEVSDREKANEDMEAINEARRLEQEKRAKEKAAEEAEKRGESALIEDSAAAVKDQRDQAATPGQMTIPFIIKADVSGSAEAVAAYIPSLTSPLIAPQILSSGVGAVNESDIEFAATAQGHIIAFNLPQNNEALGLAESKGVKILENNVIYRTLDQVKEVLEAKLPPLVTQRVLGEAEIAMGFDIKLVGRKTMKIAGCKVRNGVVGMKSKVRVMRGGVGGEKVYDGLITSLKNVKKDVQEMRKGTECGMGFEDWEGFEVGDVVQTYEEISEKRRL